MSTLLKFTRFPYEEPYHVQLLVEAAYGGQQASIEYYANASDLLLLGKALSDFPFQQSNEHVYEIGSEAPEDRFAYYLRLRTFLIRAVGDVGIEIRFNNRAEPPDLQIAEFTIQTNVAGINRLGRLLLGFWKT